MFRASDEKVARRRALAIHGYMGANGHGKTATMIRDTIADVLADRPILSTVPLNDPRTGRTYDGFTLFEHWDQLHAHRGGPLLLDEVTGVLDAREDGMPQHIRVLLPQLRKRGVVVRYTAPDFDNADRRLRQISWGITVCRGYAPAPSSKGAEIEAWRPNRLFSAITFDTVTMTQLTEGYRKKAKVKIREWWWGPTSGVFDLYDTMAAVSQVSSHCPACGLPFQKRYHSDKTCQPLHEQPSVAVTEPESVVLVDGADEVPEEPPVLTWHIPPADALQPEAGQGV